VHSEQRKEVRSIYPHQHRGKLQVLSKELCLSVYSVKDVSPTGIRLEVKTPVDVGQNIWVRYVDEKVDIKLNGTIAWNSVSSQSKNNISNSNTFLIGIKLASPSLLQVLW
jgi:hypothetical protein